MWIGKGAIDYVVYHTLPHQQVHRVDTCLYVVYMCRCISMVSRSQTASSLHFYRLTSVCKKWKEEAVWLRETRCI